MASIKLDISQRLDITCRKGDTFSLSVDFTDSTGAAIDLSSYSFQMEVRDSGTDAVIIATSSIDFVKNADSTTGRLNVLITSSDVTPSGSFIYDLESTKTSNLFVQTWLFGVFTINDDVTA